MIRLFNDFGLRSQIRKLGVPQMQLLWLQAESWLHPSQLNTLRTQSPNRILQHLNHHKLQRKWGSSTISSQSWFLAILSNQTSKSKRPRLGSRHWLFYRDFHMQRKFCYRHSRLRCQLIPVMGFGNQFWISFSSLQSPIHRQVLYLLCFHIRNHHRLMLHWIGCLFHSCWYSLPCLDFFYILLCKWMPHTFLEQ